MIYFVVPAMLTDIGYKKIRKFIGGFSVARTWSKRLKRYVEWKKHVAECYNVEIGSPSLPFVWGSHSPGYVVTRAYFAGRQYFPDPENCRKSIVDALAYVPKGEGRSDDSYLGGWHEAPLFDRHNPRVDVWIFTLAEREHVNRLLIWMGWGGVPTDPRYEIVGSHNLDEPFIADLYGG